MKTDMTEAIKKLYTIQYGEDYEKRIFDNDIESALKIILSEKQTGITPQEFVKALTRAAKQKGKNCIECETGSIEVDMDAALITMLSRKNGKKKFTIKLHLEPKILKIDNYCEVEYKNSEIICNIPERFTKSGSIKNEVSEFIIPETISKNAYERIFYTTAESSICRALGISELSIEEQEMLKRGEILESEHGFAHFDGNTLTIKSSNKNVETSKSYRLDSVFHSRVIYNKDEIVKLEKPEDESE